jgi:hypothetical protein
MQAWIKSEMFLLHIVELACGLGGIEDQVPAMPGHCRGDQNKQVVA